MKKILALCSALISHAVLANDTLSHTFFSVRQNFHGALPEKIAQFYGRMGLKEDGIHGTLELTTFGGNSTDPEELARFFMPYGRTLMIAGEFGSDTVKDRSVDILANYFGVLTRPIAEVFNSGTGQLVTDNLTFQSAIHLKPKQSIFGVGLTYRQELRQTGEHSRWWIQIAAPLLHVHNEVGFDEVVTNSGGGAVPEGFVGTVKEALLGETVFGDKHFKYGKISNCPLTKTGIGDIELYVGYENTACSCVARNLYFGLIIPVGNRPQGEYIFEPIIGNNKHAGLVLGTQYGLDLWENETATTKLYSYYTMHSEFLLENCQRRSLDLMDKMWSRYIWLYKEKPMTSSILNITPGINILTQDVKVTARGSFNINTAIIVAHKKFLFEFGYNAYMRQAEHVRLVCPFKEGPGIAGFNEADISEVTTKSQATIRAFLLNQGIRHDTDFVTNTPEYIPLSERDLDLRSAAHPALISNILYLALGGDWKDLKYPMFSSIGVSYEVSFDNAALQRWLLWVKGGIAF